MTKFVKENFNYAGGYLTYNGKFVARFKYAKDSKGTFVTFLTKNFTTEEYFAELANKAPLTILESKGYVTPGVKKLLKRAGYAPTVEGMNAYLESRVR